jgi:ABC-type molybdate transport system permease subunit
LGSVSSLVSEKKIFEISAIQSIVLALAAMLNIRLERKTETLKRTIQGTFLLRLVPIGPVVSGKKLEM